MMNRENAVFVGEEKGSLPIIVVHQGNSPPLEICLRQARKSNPQARIVWLHGASDHPLDFVECHSFQNSDLFQEVPFFHSIYQHFSSSNSLEAERFCMSRWLIVRNFMRREKLTRCLGIDSDVLLFCDVREEARRFEPYAMTFAHWNATQNLIHCNFIQNVAALESFTEYMLQVYQNQDLLERVKQTSHKKGNRYRVSDMSLFYDWSCHVPFRFCFYEDFYVDGIFFDSCIDFTHDFQASRYLPGIFRPFKRITWRNERPYATLKNGLQAPMKTIHYHGDLKFLMPLHNQHRSPHFVIFWHLFCRKIKKIPHKWKLLWNNHLCPIFSITRKIS
ncbi:MAG: hypothetical protein Q4D62_02555 [Planctomycetia bacterium]|nr:hypothetical protein [Planctomycetia bacterium]